MRKTLWTLALVGAVLVWSAAAQTSTGTQGSTGAGTGVSAGGAQAGATTNTQVSGAAGGHSAEAGGQSNTSVNAQTPPSSPESKKSAKKDKGGDETEAAGGASLASGTKIEAELSKGLDSRKAKPGDKVEAKVTRDVRTANGAVIRRGSKLVGHVTEAKARAKGDAESALGIAFDKAISKGQEIPFNATVQAIAAAQTGVAMQAGAMDADTGGQGDMGGGARTGSSGSMGGGPVAGAGSAVGGVGSAAGQTVGSVGKAAGGVTQTAGGAVDTTASAAGNAAGAVGGTASGALQASSTGVVGLKDLSLSSGAAAAGEASVITSTGKNVHLDSGTQMILNVVAK